MATGELLSELVRAHYADDERRFGTILGQLIAAESRSGHLQVARRLREVREEGGEKQPPTAIPLARAKKELSELLEVTYSEVRLGDLLLDPSIATVLAQYVREQRAGELLSKHGLVPRRKLLLHGPPGTGKTLSALALAGELGLPVARVRIELLFSRLMGETAAALTEIFLEARRMRAVYLFDEFDVLGQERQTSGDVGEIRRVVSTFLQLLDGDRSESLFVAATNIKSSLDHALFRRFDDVIEYRTPSSEESIEFLRRRLRGSSIPARAMRGIAEVAGGLTLADLGIAVDDARKQALLGGDAHPKAELVERAVRDRLGSRDT